MRSGCIDFSVRYFSSRAGILTGSATSETMMEVRQTRNCVPAGAVVLCALLVCSANAVRAQNPSSANNPFYGSITVQPVNDHVLHLSLDEAIERGLHTNLGLKEAEAGEKELHGLKNEALQEFLPNISLSGGTGVYQHNLAALGFGPSTISKLASNFPGGTTPAGLSTITKDDLTQGQINFSQTLFSGPVIAGWKAANAAERFAYFAKMTARGEVVQQVATVYLRAVSAQSEVDNRLAQVRTDQVALENAQAAHAAGTAPHLDELRAQVELESQQQALLVAQNAREKDLILLTRSEERRVGKECRSRCSWYN